MAGVNNSPNECFGCDSENVEFMSLLPRRVTNVIKTLSDGKNTEVDVPRGNNSFNVCKPCYLMQYAEVYPGEPLPEL